MPGDVSTLQEALEKLSVARAEEMRLIRDFNETLAALQELMKAMEHAERRTDECQRAVNLHVQEVSRPEGGPLPKPVLEAIGQTIHDRVERNNWRIR